MEFCSKFFLFLFLNFLNFLLPSESKAADAIEVPEDIPYPCDLAPNGPAIKGCIMLLDWYREAAELIDANRTHPTPLPPTAALSIRNIGYSPAMAYEIYTCMNNICLCRHFAGDMDWEKKECTLLDGQILQKAERKEIRMLTEEERKKLFSAFHQLKNGENFTEYSRFVSAHELNKNFAHGGPAFLPWHREYLKRFEIALRYIDPSLAIPYWDSTLDQRLPNPSFSILWSEEFFGTPSEDGQQIVDGPFSNWTTIENKPLNRQLENSPDSLFDDQMILDFEDKGVEGFLGFSLSKIHELCSKEHNFLTLESRHAGVHLFVGGQMANIQVSPNDPVFWMHHAFIDWIWEDWRQRHQSPEQREQDYPEEFVQKCADKVARWHHLDSEMAPFKDDFGSKLTVKEGLSNQYTAEMYEYGPRPTCTEHIGCDSEYLFCDRSDGGHKCVSKMREGGPCDKFQNGENPCYKGQCVDGKCKNDEQQKPVKKRNCLNSHECCEKWAQLGLCQTMTKFMGLWCSASCGFENCAALKYELKDDCSDRHYQCGYWSINMDGTDECARNPLWMAENCRKSCKFCGQSREQKCKEMMPPEN